MNEIVVRLKVDLDNPANVRIIDVDGTPLIGECKRCGECCRILNCEHLIEETIDDKFVARCAIYQKRPVRCVIWPLPDDELPDNCGYTLG
jgi:hypothetical protein